MLLEVGMGGRLDAVNIVDPDVAVVTSIALDHCEWLGYDLESIGREKAGIYRAHRPALFGSPNPPSSVVQTARDIDARFLQSGKDFGYALGDGQWDWFMGGARLDGLPLPRLFGATQVLNATTSLAVLECLNTRVPVNRIAIEQGLRTVNLPGRFQRVDARERLWILDVAHNPASARTLAENLRALPTAGRTLTICGILGDKDIEAIAHELASVVDEWIVVPLSSPRALPVEELAKRLAAGGATSISTAPSIESAIAQAHTSTTDRDRIVVFGSFLTVGPMLDALEV
jgi:dihydrofolate synthase/folylpolyglutamate synthase